MKYLLLRLTRLIKKVILKLATIENADSCNRQVTSDGAVFLIEAKVDNMQKDPSKIKIGKGTHIRGNISVFSYGGSIEIGEYSYIGSDTKIWSGDSIKIGSNVMIGHHINIIDFSHKSYSIERGEAFRSLITIGHPKEKGNIPSRPIVIEDDVIIYAGCQIVMGVTIGKGSIISAGSVVIKNVPPYSQVIGNPAKVFWKSK